MSEHRPGSGIKPVRLSTAPLWGLVAQAATRQVLLRWGQMPELARIPRQARTLEYILLPPQRHLLVPISFSRNSSRCQLEAHCPTTAPSAQIFRLRGDLL